MSSKLKLKATAGGSATLVADDTLTTDEEFVIQDPIGVNQTWQDVKPSRAQDVNYTNDTGNPISVNVGLISNVGGKAKMRFYVDGLLVTNPIIGAVAGEQSIAIASVIVPNGGVYKIDDDNVTCTIFYWSELRGV